MRRVILRHAAAAAFVVLAIAAPLRAQNAFYTSLFDRGLTNAKQGNWKLASQQLRIAAFGMLLRDSPWRGASTYEGVAAMAKGAVGDDPRGYRREFVDLVKKARRIADPAR